MGASIYVENKKEEELFYFRDAYNYTNLAWIVGLSYWQCGKTKKKRIEFLEKLSQIPDEKIKTHVDELFEKNDDIKDEKAEWIKMFKAKRNDLKKHLPVIKDPKNTIVWSV